MKAVVIGIAARALVATGMAIWYVSVGLRWAQRKLLRLSARAFKRAKKLREEVARLRRERKDRELLKNQNTEEMALLISASIDLSKIDKSRIKTHDANGQPFANGAMYYNITVAVNDEKDQYDYDCNVQQGQTKEEREAKLQKVYLGNGRVIWRSAPEGQPAAAPAQGQAPAPQGQAPAAPQGNPTDQFPF